MYKDCDELYLKTMNGDQITENILSTKFDSIIKNDKYNVSISELDMEKISNKEINILSMNSSILLEGLILTMFKKQLKKWIYNISRLW